MLENGDLLFFDNGNGRPAAEGGQYSRALELALDWDSMTATKVWEYRHQVETSGAVAVLDMQGNNNIYRALPVETLFGEVPGK